MVEVFGGKHGRDGNGKNGRHHRDAKQAIAVLHANDPAIGAGEDRFERESLSEALLSLIHI